MLFCHSLFMEHVPATPAWIRLLADPPFAGESGHSHLLFLSFALTLLIITS